LPHSTSLCCQNSGNIGGKEFLAKIKKYVNI
jgi:hypothetical protein